MEFVCGVGSGLDRPTNHSERCSSHAIPARPTTTEPKRMKSFPPEAFAPLNGKLTQLIYENPDRGVAPRLEFALEIPFEPFELDDEEEEVTTALWISGIRPEVKSFRELAGQALGTSALTGSEGSVRLFHAMNPVELSELRFEAVGDGTVEVELQADIDFELDGDEEYGIVTISLKAPLEIHGLRIATSIDKRLNGDPDAICSEIGSLVDLSAYGAPERVPGGLVLPPLD